LSGRAPSWRDLLLYQWLPNITGADAVADNLAEVAIGGPIKPQIYIVIDLPSQWRHCASSSHSLIRRYGMSMSVLASTADIQPGDKHFRFVPKAEVIL
jgi:hypothetical protein